MKILVISNESTIEQQMLQGISAEGLAWYISTTNLEVFENFLNQPARYPEFGDLHDIACIVVDAKASPDVDAWLGLREQHAAIQVIPVVAWTRQMSDRVSRQLLEHGVKDFIEDGTAIVIAMTRIKAILGTQQKEQRQPPTKESASQVIELSDQAGFSILGEVDKLTGLMNRSWFERNLVQEWRRCYRHHSHLSMILLRVDDWSLFAQSMNADMGERTLRRMARWIQSALSRAGDVVTRYGEDSFAVLMPDTDGDGAMHVASHIATIIQHAVAPAPSVGRRSQLTVSMGVSGVLPTLDLDPLILATSAGAALEKCVELGGDAVRRLDPISEISPFPKAE